MTLLKQLRTSFIKRLVGGVEAEHHALMRCIEPPLIILGFPRSGTSLIGQLGHAAGYNFGESRHSLRPDVRNPRGYFENGTLFTLSRNFLREAGILRDLDPVPNGFRARGPINRIKRAYTRRAMMRTLNGLASKSPFGMKLFPRFFYFWKLYLPNSLKLVAIYRDPYAVVRSFMTAWPGGYTADHVLSLWADHNRDLLYQIENTPSSFLLKYEDLLDATKQSRVLAALADYLEVPVDTFKLVVDEKLNRSKTFENALPLPPHVLETYEALETRRKYSV